MTGGAKTEGRGRTGQLALHHRDSEQPVSMLELSCKVQGWYKKVTLPGPDGRGQGALGNLTHGGANLGSGLE